MTSNVAFIVEWDNARLSEVDRARDMLRQLNTQAAAYANKTNAKFELILIYDPEEIPKDLPSSVLAECVDEKTWPGTIRLLEAVGLPYYEQKNFGVQQTNADLIFFVDSDIIPDKDWLALLMDALRNPDIKVIGGETYLSNDTFYEKLVSAFWQFETQGSAGRPEIYETRGFYANNVVFRGDILRENPFPTLKSYRGACAALAANLRAHGYKIYRHGAARVSHPPPEGMSHFVSRAICHGHDMMMVGATKNAVWFRASPLGSVWRYLRDLVNAPGRITARYRQAGLGVAGWLAAMGLAFTYYTLKFFGDLMSFFAPRKVRQYFSI